MSALANKRGAFILFEGIDRCGKTTQTKLLSDYLQTSRGASSTTELIRIPNRESNIGQLINSYLASASNMNDNTIHLLFSANRWEASTEMETKLLAGTNLICDRYCYSGVAFSSAKGVKSMDFDWCKSCDRGLIAPDCVIYLDMPVEEAAQRGSYGEERYEKIDFQLKVREKFMALKNEDEGRLPWYTLDARKSIDELKGEIQAIADKCIDTVHDEQKELKRMW